MGWQISTLHGTGSAIGGVAVLHTPRVRGAGVLPCRVATDPTFDRLDSINVSR